MSGRFEQGENSKGILSLNRLKRRVVGINFAGFFDDIRNAPEGMIKRPFTEHGNLALVFFNFFPKWDEDSLLKMFDLIFETFTLHYHQISTLILIAIS